jgi:ATP phosphoribosyltransferase regulatory subunit
MRDLLPREARIQAELARRLLDVFELHGYELVSVPLFEYAHVLERGLGALPDDEVLRFVEPETGAVVLLRPDMTPQIARLLASRLADAPGPARLSYQGSVLRRRRERARRQRQILQAGIELVGKGGLEGDLEVLAVASAAARRAGLAEFAFDLGHAGIAGSLLASVDPENAASIVEALALRDTPEVERRAQRAKVDKASLHGLLALPELHGGSEVWSRAERALSATPAKAAVAELKTLWQAATEAELAPRLGVDCAEVRDFAYYTGAVFHVYASGPGRAIGAGGRYDGLHERFGRSRPAAGFAFRLDDLGWALERAGKGVLPPHRLLLQGAGEEFLRELRGWKLPCVVAPQGDPFRYAKAWGYTHVVEVTLSTATLVRVEDLAREPLPRDAGALAAATAALLERSPGEE